MKEYKLWSETHPEVKWKITLGVNWYYIKKWAYSCPLINLGLLSCRETLYHKRGLKVDNTIQG